MAPRRGGLILVFDLDQTLIDTATFRHEKGRISNIGKYMNIRLIEEVLKPASKLRGNGVDGIFLFTNNTADAYIEGVCKYLATTIRNTDGNAFFFDYVMTPNDSYKGAEDPYTKSISKIEHILRHKCPYSHRERDPVTFKDYSDLAERLFFFDDQEHPNIREFFQGVGSGANIPNFSNHYMQIQGRKVGDGFVKGAEEAEDDRTDYEPIKRELAKIGPSEAPQGGSRKRHKRERKRERRLTKHARRRKN
jgi:hypothetical protein